MVKRRGFTLVELLIVVVVVLILLAVALPSFLDAQTLADLTQTRSNMLAMEAAMEAHLADWGSVPADYNDSDLAIVTYRARSATNPVCSMEPDDDFSTDGGLDFSAYRRNHYADGIHCPLTTPIAYISPHQTIDPFSDGTVPFGYDSREITGGIAYGGFFSAGPDKVAGHWVRGCMVWNGRSIGCPYSPTNGLASKGEFWGIVTECVYGSNPSDPCLAEKEFPYQHLYPAVGSDITSDGRTDVRDLYVLIRDWRNSTAPSR